MECKKISHKSLNSTHRTDYVADMLVSFHTCFRMSISGYTQHHHTVSTNSNVPVESTPDMVPRGPCPL